MNTCNVVGLIGAPFEIETTSSFTSAVLSYKVNPELLGETEFDNLMFLWYDEENGVYVELETVTDEDNMTVSTTVTHFSRYMIVDSYKWFDAWAEEFDYNPNNKTTVYNTVLAIDCSGSMASIDRVSGAFGSRSCERITAAANFIDNIAENEKIAIVLFTNTASIICSLTDDKVILKNSLQYITSSGGTSFTNAISKSINAFNANELNQTGIENRIILLTDGVSSASNAILDRANDKGIKIHTIGLGYASSDSSLITISPKTGGEFFKAYYAQDLVDVYEDIGLSSDFDTTDTDGDGLYDAVEAAGIRLQNGVILRNEPETDTIYTDPTKYDTDGDGLSDGKEINPKIKSKTYYYVPSDVPKSEDGTVYYFDMISDPNNPDSDGDELLDGERVYYNNKVMLPIDSNPLIYNGPEGVWQAQKNQVENGTIATEYTQYMTPDNSLMVDMAKNSNFWVNGLLYGKGFIDEDFVNNIEKYFKDSAENELAAEAGADFLDFNYDNMNIAYHSDKTNWQRAFVYNDIYDKIFEYGSEMLRNKINFTYDNEKYILWSWKGDYWNLQSGAETGLYVYNRNVNGVDHYDVVDYELPMTLSLYNLNNEYAENVFSWAPNEEQWWITGFNPSFKEPNPHIMTMVCSVDFTGHEAMYEVFKESNYITESSGTTEFIYDDEYHTLWLVWAN